MSDFCFYCSAKPEICKSFLCVAGFLTLWEASAAYFGRDLYFFGQVTHQQALPEEFQVAWVNICSHWHVKINCCRHQRGTKMKCIIFLEIWNRSLPVVTANSMFCLFFARLNSSDQDGEPMYIQMVTALVLQLIQCVVHLPSDKDVFEEYDKVGEQTDQKPSSRVGNLFSD